MGYHGFILGLNMNIVQTIESKHILIPYPHNIISFSVGLMGLMGYPYSISYTL